MSPGSTEASDFFYFKTTMNEKDDQSSIVRSPRGHWAHGKSVPRFGVWLKKCLLLGRGREAKYLVDGGGGKGGWAARAGTESTYLGTCLTSLQACGCGIMQVHVTRMQPQESPSYGVLWKYIIPTCLGWYLVTRCLFTLEQL